MDAGSPRKSWRCRLGFHHHKPVWHWKRPLWCEVGYECVCGDRYDRHEDHWTDHHEETGVATLR